MADGTITPITQVTATPGVGQQTQGTTESGVLLSGTIIGKDVNGNFLLKTVNGNLSLQSNLPLTYNSDVVIRMDAGGAQANASSAKIISVNGEPFSEFVQPGQAEADSISGGALLSQASQSGVPTETNTALPNIIRAVVVSTPVANNATQVQVTNTPPALASGTEVVVRLPDTPSPSPISPQVAPQTGTPPQAVSQQAALQQTATQDSTRQPAVSQPVPPLQSTSQVTVSQPAIPVPQPPVAPPVDNSGGTTANNTKPPPANTPAAALATPQNNIIPQAVQPPSNPLYAVYVKQASLSEQSAPSTAPSPSPEPTPSDNTQAKAPVIQGQLIAATKDGTITIQTSSGTVTLKSAPMPALVNLAPGTSLTIESPENIPQPVVATPQPVFSSAPDSLAEIAASWSTLKDILNIVQSSNADTTNQTAGGQANSLLSRLPVLGSTFLSSSLSFITQLAGGNIHQILGDDVINTLKQNGRTDLLQKFTSELATLTTAFSTKPEHATPGWQTTFLPFVYDGALQQARIYIKRDAPNKKQQGGSNASGGTRFVVEVSLSEFGGVQMDGLIRKQQANTIFDLMIRSNTGFSPKDQAEISSIYTDAAQQTGFTGTLTFQVTKNFPVKPLDEILANQKNIVTA